MKNQCIAAISTAFGKGGIAVIRISGEGAIEVAGKMFRPAGKKKLTEISGGRAVYGKIYSEGRMIDDGIATVFRAPNSFTGEDTVEISCHGGVLLTERVLKTAFMCGAVQAQAGEFTQRAFLNGKIDLSGAEAVIGLIEAESEEKLNLCASHAAGVLKRRTEEIYGKVLHLLSSVYVGLDYPEEDLEEVSDEDFRASLESIYAELEKTASTYREGKAVAEGVRTVLLGKPNAGKSSLLNALLGENRAIVTDIPGTTRDVIEEKVNCGRIILRLADTAGIRQSGDAVEKIGIEKAIEKARESELMIAVFDVSRPLDGEDEKLISLIAGEMKAGKSVIAAINKSDSEERFTEDELLARFKAELGSENGFIKTVRISARDGNGVDDLKKACESLFADGYTDYASVAVVCNARQFSAVCAAKDAVSRALAAFDSGLGSDVCGMDLESALAALGEIDGRSVSEEVTSSIFHNFCVGK
ncbi:MAG: tRNA uridine-5-carboxymethylaminomethyl(34) synthesis GTPase MnmE [Ruminococcaceae bacterium]|nr:tRNA uridine-5-carboxymethylaminomethyl(34) synthesis GTPase MnmE [Oscillospiraceae bacterium]